LSATASDTSPKGGIDELLALHALQMTARAVNLESLLRIQRPHSHVRAVMRLRRASWSLAT
jgi:hypothetical protein